jgi:hypothetical protein
MFAPIGHNQPPAAIEMAAPTVEELRLFLADNPVISDDDEARAAKALLDRVILALKDIESERDDKVRPLNEQVKAINAEYHHLHNVNKKTPGLWDKLVNQLWSRMSAYALDVERRRFAAEQAARHAAEEAAEEARRAAEAEAVARDMAADGVCDIDMAGAIEAADTTSQIALRAMWTARRAEGNTKVRITGGIGNAVSLKDHETLTVADWRSAIEEMSGDDGRIPQDIADAILKCARAHRKAFDQLPAGVIATYVRSL